MNNKDRLQMMIAVMAAVVIALIFGMALKKSNESLKEADATIAEADRFIATYERRNYEVATAQETTQEATEQEQVAVEDRTDAELHEQSEVLPVDSFYWLYQNMEQPTWDDCVEKASAIGMDEYSLTVMAGWTVRECYTEYDPYLAYLCAMCPLHYWSQGMNIGWGLSGFGSDPSYTDENLIGYSYSISNNELKILYLALTYPIWNIYGCDGVSHYGYGCIYESWCEGYLIRVWAN